MTPIRKNQITDYDKAVTQSEGNNSTFVATTEYVDRAMEPLIYTTVVPVTINATTLISGVSQKGKTLVVDNSANAVQYNVDASNKFNVAILKHGSGAITFMQGSGRTLVQVSGTNILSGAVGSTATIVSIGTTDYLRISNA